MKRLVEAAERERISEAYRAAYREAPIGGDGYGDLAAFHAEAEAERVAARAGESW